MIKFENRYKIGDIMSAEQWAIYDKLVFYCQREQAKLYWKKCEKENRTVEYQAFLDNGLFAGMGSDGRFMD